MEGKIPVMRREILSLERGVQPKYGTEPQVSTISEVTVSTGLKASGSGWAQEVQFQNAQVDWAVPFTYLGKRESKAPTP